jgi:hypothetical protein
MDFRTYVKMRRISNLNSIFCGGPSSCFRVASFTSDMHRHVLSEWIFVVGWISQSSIKSLFRGNARNVRLFLALDLGLIAQFFRINLTSRTWSREQNGGIAFHSELLVFLSFGKLGYADSCKSGTGHALLVIIRGVVPACGHF